MYTWGGGVKPPVMVAKDSFLIVGVDELGFSTANEYKTGPFADIDTPAWTRGSAQPGIGGGIKGTAPKTKLPTKLERIEREMLLVYC